MKTLCNGKINTSGICEKCYQVSQTTSGYCSRLIDIYPEDDTVIPPHMYRNVWEAGDGTIEKY